MKISIIIPCHNSENYILNCLNSAINQTYDNIEIICIDDCSSDRSRSIIEDCAAKDSRIRVIAYNENKSQSQARKDGVSLASGDYILFLDSDDTLNINTCERLAQIATEHPQADILCFDTKVIITNHKIDKSRASNLEKWLNSAKHDEYKDIEIINAAFKTKEIPFTLWNKLYKANVAKKAFQKVKNGFYPKGQDAYAFFFLAEESRKLIKIREQFYNYSFGNGVAGSSELSKKQFERVCSQGLIINELIEYSKKNRKADNFNELIYGLRDAFFNECFGKWQTQLNVHDTSEGYQSLLKYFPPVLVILKILEKWLYNQGYVAGKLCPFPKVVCSAVKKIGIFYHRLSFGGVQHVIKHQIDFFITAGYDVTVFIEEKTDSDNTFKINEKAKIIQVCKSVPYNKENASKHLISFNNQLKNNPVDLMIYHAGSSANLIWDLMLFHALNIESIVVHHESFAHYLTTLTNYGIDRHKVFALANRVVTLTRSASIYFSALGCESIYIPNFVKSNQDKEIAKGNNKTILCVGRLDDNIKQYHEAVKILKYARLKDNQIRLKFVGNFNSEKNKENFVNFIKKQNLELAIDFEKGREDISRLYLNSGCLLITSVSEGFSLVLAEAKSFGLPVVLYDLPYLDLVRDKMGVIAVDQGDSQTAANAIVHLFNNKEEWIKFSHDAKSSFTTFSKIDIGRKWLNVVSHDIQADKSNIDKEELRIILEAIIFNYSKSVQKYKQLENNMKKTLIPNKCVTNVTDGLGKYSIKAIISKLLNFK